MAATGPVNIDPHLCTCFSVGKQDIDGLKKALLDAGYESPWKNEAPGQIADMTMRLSELQELRFTVFYNGIISAEVRPPEEYPLAHLDDRYEYPAHEEIKGVLEKFLHGRYAVAPDVPGSCTSPKVVVPENPVKGDISEHADELLLASARMVAQLPITDGYLKNRPLSGQDAKSAGKMRRAARP